MKISLVKNLQYPLQGLPLRVTGHVNKSINRTAWVWSYWSSWLRHRCPFCQLPEGSTRGVFRSNDPTNIRRPSAISWYPCHDVWLEALERLTLSFCLTIPVLICEGDARLPISSAVLDSPFPSCRPSFFVPESGFLQRFLRAILKVLDASPSIRSDASPTASGTRTFSTHMHANARAHEREMIGKFDFPGQLMLLW